MAEAETSAREPTAATAFVTTEHFTLSVLAGASVALLVALVANHSLAGALAAGGAVTSAALVAMTRHQYSAWTSLSAATGR